MKLTELVEDIYLSPDSKRVVVATSNSKVQRASGDDFISTAKPKLPHRSSSTTRTGGVVVYSAYLYHPSKIVTEILSSIKGKGPYEVIDNSVNHFIDETAAWMGPILQSRINPTLVVFPRSSSGLTKRFAASLTKHFKNAEMIEDAFVKNVINITGDEQKDRAMVGSLIDIDHPKFETLSKETVDELEKRLLSLLKREGSGIVPIKKIYKPLAQFIKGFIKAENIKENLKGARVLVVDDIQSSGTTMREMVQIAEARGAETINGATIFRQTSKASEKK